MHQSIEVDEKVFQDAVKFYGSSLNIPPLASKIYSYLIFDFEKVGITFDEFVEVLSASKSSVSTSISLLLNSQLIIDLNKMDERKRYFFINDEHMKIRFEKIVQRLQDELKLLNDLNNLRKVKDEDYNEKLTIYKALLNKNISNIQESINKL
ncbi:MULTISPECIES: transcriptional regulator [Chryseobacterium]|uniref:transcriptional regulator n=1 Tax=Chryseobacterium TaxID=59732 RepID=UPI001BE97372|nr:MULTISPECIES: transcriptional regulator [Chryseobacterium]MBT2619633.1 transcriptional regulator [Chryseobacterium sp. ISL-6]